MFIFYENTRKTLVKYSTLLEENFKDSWTYNNDDTLKGTFLQSDLFLIAQVPPSLDSIQITLDFYANMKYKQEKVEKDSKQSFEHLLLNVLFSPLFQECKFA